MSFWEIVKTMFNPFYEEEKASRMDYKKNFGNAIASEETYGDCVLDSIRGYEYDVWGGNKTNLERRVIDFRLMAYNAKESILAWFEDINDFVPFAGIVYSLINSKLKIEIYVSTKNIDVEDKIVNKLIEKGIVKFKEISYCDYIIIFDRKNSMISSGEEQEVVISVNRDRGDAKTLEILSISLERLAELKDIKDYER